MPDRRRAPRRLVGLAQRLAHREATTSSDRLAYQASLLAPYLNERSIVLDVGCGNGMLGAYVRELTGCKLVSMDIADTRAAIGDFLLFDGYHFPCASHSVDYVILSFVLHHTAAPLAFCKEVLRVARRGVFVFEDLPATRSQRVLLAAHIVFFSWLYDLPWPARLPWHFPYLDALNVVQAAAHLDEVSMPMACFRRIYPMSRQFYTFLLRETV